MISVIIIKDKARKFRAFLRECYQCLKNYINIAEREDLSLLIERKLILNKDLVIYLLGGALVMLINYLVVRFIVKTEKQAIIFVIVKAVLVAGAAIYAL